VRTAASRWLCRVSPFNRWGLSHLTRFFLSLVFLIANVGVLPVVSAAPDSIEVSQVSIEPIDSPEGGWQLSANFAFELNPRLEEVVNRGVPLYFVAEFELTRPRWYWFDEQAASVSQSYRLSYHALTRQYRVSIGSLQQGFPTLKEALDLLSSIRDWKVVDKGAVKFGSPYLAAVRLKLDVAQMPKPFQVNAITNRDWALSSEWRRFAFVPNQDSSR
jgi:hypothetical protein